jgi:hypothetical protein
MCECSEGFVEEYASDGVTLLIRRPTRLGRHNCEYIKRRNALIPEAKRLASNTIDTDGVGRLKYDYSKLFIQTMNMLAREAGLVE